MDHKISNISDLHSVSKNLYDNCVMNGEASANQIIKNLGDAINVLKNSWEGQDAGVQIQNVVLVYNGMVALSNRLGSLAGATTKIAKTYREIQISNGAKSDSLTEIKPETKKTMEDYSDTRDSINITSEAANAKNKIDAAKNGLDAFESRVKSYLGDITNNWQAGFGRDGAVELFNEFQTKVKSYKETLASVSKSISTALQNYTM